MIIMKTIILLILIIPICSAPLLAQENTSPIETKKWAITGGVGLNTTSTNSKNASLLNYNWSFGVARTLKVKAKTTHSLHLKFLTFRESLKNLNYYYLDNNNALINEKYNQINSYAMVYLGYNIKYDINQHMFLQGAIGFNYMLPAKYKRTSTTKNGTQKFGRPSNFYITRPELSLGIGFKEPFGINNLEIKPIYSYNFTIRRLNLVPTFHSLGIETSFYF